MPYSSGQRLERSEVEPWIAETFAFPYFLAQVTEKEEPQHNRIRVITTITGPNGERLVANGRQSTYYALKPMVGMLQFSEDWTA